LPVFSLFSEGKPYHGLKTVPRAFTLIALLILAALPAVAQTHIQFFSSKTGAVPTECQQEAAILAPLLTEFHSPSWTWIIACDEAAWHRVELHIGQQDSVGGLMLGTTDLENHVTYVRGFYVLHPFNSYALAQPQHTIAHELGHITLNTHDEAKAERKARELLSGTLVAMSR
jgi:hypothetical protein